MSQSSSPQRMKIELPLGNNPRAVRRRLEMLERFLERGFSVPGINREFGMDAVIGLVPVAGDAIGALLGLYMVWEGRNLGMSRWQISRMVGRVTIDTVIGMVPIAGDAFDLFYRSNSANLSLIIKHMDKHYPETRIIENP